MNVWQDIHSHYERRSYPLLARVKMEPAHPVKQLLRQELTELHPNTYSMASCSAANQILDGMSCQWLIFVRIMPQ